MMARAIIIQWGIPLQRGHPSLRATSSARPNVAGPRLSITGTFNVESQPIALLNLVWIDARGLQRRDVQKYVRAAGVVSDETVTAFGIPHFQFSGRHRVLFPLRLQPSTCGPPTSYSRFNRSVIISQKPCNSALLRTGPASTPNVSRQIPWVSPAKHKRDNAEAIFS